ncbi:hypothetical protein CEY16_07855 [Halalkalibacillus sediminis]|uniref:Chromosome segregation ATPase n=1 Tax=Halalkalibacillus sediminis TaxID=2018042 RepID=A0A2I0QU57_9BACI|nr:hypothetical protein [Halalkalibacillus sediminis]PKR77834.1 hypothetical protein CEY16_07855 [Halalkalibacillus sediminis]
MPRINRLRISGLHYDSMKKKYLDRTFDFNDGYEAANTLISMINGGGKGVLLQTIFQVLMPGTAWGEEGNRKYQQFFYNERETFKPYTFHVLIEWQLDDVEQQSYLMTGIACSAEKYVTSDEDENDYKIEKKFLFYNQDYTQLKGSFMSGGELLINQSGKSATQLEAELAVYGIKPYRNEKQHRNVLDSYGIRREDWNIQKQINRAEGGVGKYFEGAENDHALFQKKIIPAISQRLKEDFTGDDLVEIFISQAKIAQNLPILLSRETSHRKFIDIISPFLEAVEKGENVENNSEVHVQQGKYLMNALQHVLEKESTDLQDYQSELNRLQEKESQFRFELMNLDYAKKETEHLGIDKEIEEIQKWQEDIRQKHKITDEEVQKISALIKKLKWMELQKEVKELKKSELNIQNSRQLKDIEDKKQEIEKKAIQIWEEDAKSQIQHNDWSFGQKMEELDEQEDENTRKLDTLKDQKTDLLSNQNNLKQNASEFQQYEEEMIDRFTASLQLDPEYILAATDKELNETLAKKNHYTELIESEEQYLDEMKQEKTEVISLMQTKDEKIKEVSSERIDRERIEAELATELAKVIHQDFQGNSRVWFNRAKKDVGVKLEGLQKRLHEEQKALWQKQLDKSLNNNEFWIANKDLKRVKEKLDSYMDVTYGTEFLQSLPENQMLHELKANPLLPYSLIVEQEYSEITHGNVEVFHSPVPVYVRSQMNKSGIENHFLVTGQETSIIKNQFIFLEWKNQLDEELKTNLSLVEELEKQITYLEDLGEQIRIRESIGFAIDLIEQEEQLQEEIEGFRLKHDDLLQQINKCKQQIYEAEKTCKNLAEKEEKLLKDQDDLRNYLIKLKGYEVQKKELKRLIEEIERLEDSILEHKHTTKQIREESKSWSGEYHSWKAMVQSDLERLKILSSEFKYPEPLEVTERTLDHSITFLHGLNGLGEQYHELLNQQNSEDARLMEIRGKITMLGNQINDSEKELNHEFKDWKRLEVTTYSELELRNQKERANDRLKKLAEKDRELYGQISASQTRKEKTQEELTEISEQVRAKFGREPEPVKGELQVLEKDLNKSLRTLENEIGEATAEIERLDNLVTIYEREKNRLIDQGIKEGDHGSFERSHTLQIQQNAEKTTTNWINNHHIFRKKLNDMKKDVSRKQHWVHLEIEPTNWDSMFKNSVMNSLQRLDLNNLQHVKSTVEDMVRFSQESLLQLQKDKKKGEDAKDIWASRAAMKVMSISENIRKMLAKMKVRNELGLFPLVHLKEDILPQNQEEVEGYLKDYFVTTIEQILNRYHEINEMNLELKKDIKNEVGDEKLFYIALRRRYPVLNVYNMQTNNAFSYGRPKKEYYSTWKTINKGSETKSDGSGGQKLAARTIIMMMLLSMKHETEEFWTPLINDNPFGQAASEHVLDPIFSVAKELKFQLIMVTPPELVKTEISKRFPAYYKLEFERIKGKDVVTEVVRESHRIYG